MHIGFITSEYSCHNYSGNVGGIATFIRNLAIQLVSKGHHVSVFVYSQSNSEVFEENCVNVHFVQKQNLKGFTWLVNRVSFNKYVNSVVKANKIDILEAPEWTGFTAFMSFKCPLVLRLHGSDTYFCHLENRILKQKNKFYERIALKNCDAIVGVSQFVSDTTNELFNLNRTIEVIHNTIDTHNFIPNHQNIQSKTLLYFGSVIRKKGVLEIVSVFNQLVAKDNLIKLLIVGRDVEDVLEQKSTLNLFKEQLSSEALKNFEYKSAVPYQEIINHIFKAEVILLPSFAEAFPMTWLEAMAMEKKMVTSDIGWAKELMVDGQTGFTVNPKNHNDFVNKVTSLLENDNSLQMGVNARKRIKESFNSDSIFEKNINFYKKTINEF